MTAGRLALGAIALATAFWLGTRWHRAPAAAPPAAAARPADAPRSASGAAGQTATASGSPLDAAALRQIVREELAQQAAAAPRGPEDLGNASAPAAPADPAAAAAPPLDDAAAARADDAAQIIEQAIRAGRWTASDRTALLPRSRGCRHRPASSGSAPCTWPSTAAR
ncbi:MAG: hypothetical protein IPI49_33365 [Myxococcales bacterium]|nr:hypothetical protein [Myxococcales bacterium]